MLDGATQPTRATDVRGVSEQRLPAALARLHGEIAVGTTVELVLDGRWLDDPIHRGHSVAPPRGGVTLTDVLVGAGFTLDRVDAVPLPGHPEQVGQVGRVVAGVTATRTRTLADRVGPGMKMLICGLNPSLYAADRGVPFARPGNRFWPALLAAGLATRAGDPDHAWQAHHIGFSDLAKRATRAADELAVDELRDGAARLERVAAWLRPRVVCFLGLSGYRAAVDHRAAAGPVDDFGGCAAYLMPNPSGRNAHSGPADFAAHLASAARLGGCR